MGKNSIERSRNEEGLGLSDVHNISAEVKDKFVSSGVKDSTVDNRDVVLDKAIKNENNKDSKNSSYVTPFEKEMMPDEMADRNPTDIRSESDRLSRMKENDVRELDDGRQITFDNRFRQEQENRIRNTKSEIRDNVMDSKQARMAEVVSARRAHARAIARAREKAAQEKEKATQYDRR